MKGYDLIKSRINNGDLDIMAEILNTSCPSSCGLNEVDDNTCDNIQCLFCWKRALELDYKV